MNRTEYLRAAGRGVVSVRLPASSLEMFLSIIAAFHIGNIIPDAWGHSTNCVTAATPIKAESGALQWIRLRCHIFGAAWWIPATVIGGAAAVRALTSAFALVAGITGGTMAWLLRHQLTKNETSHAQIKALNI